MNSELSEIALNAIWEGVKRNDPVAELSYVGLPQRIINTLETERLKIVFLRELLSVTSDDLLQLPNMGEKQVDEVYSALNKYHLIKQAKEKTRYYVKNRAEICRTCVHFMNLQSDCVRRTDCPLEMMLG